MDEKLLAAVHSFFEEMATKHKVRLDSLNLHITDGTLYVHQYSPHGYETYKFLEMHELTNP